MAAEFPGAIPTIESDKTDETTSAADHAAHHNQLAEEVVAIATELGTDPAGAAATVKDRLTDQVIGLDLPAPTSVEDGFGFVYDDATGAFIWTEFATKAAFDAHVADASAHTSGLEVAARAEHTAGLVSVPSGGATTTAITGVAHTIATDDRPVTLRAQVPLIAVVSLAGSAFVDIEKDGVLVARGQSGQAYAANRGVTAPPVEYRIPAGTASATYQLTMYGNGSAVSITTSTTAPAWMSAIET